MSIPTLMIKGKLRAPVDDPALQRALDEQTPIEYIIDWFRQRLNRTGIENRVLVLKAETASGKSTVFPPALYTALVESGSGARHRPGIICTQPRILTAIENVNEILKYNKNLRLGQNIGWSTKYNKMRPMRTGLLSATIGTLTTELKTNDDEHICGKYRYILIDETHERDVQTDICIMMLKSLLQRCAAKPECPFVVLMSATFDPDRFLAYFGSSVGATQSASAITRRDNFIWCVGKTAGITERWDWFLESGRKQPITNYIYGAVDAVKAICAAGRADAAGAGDILVFLPGGQEIEQCARALHALNAELPTAQKLTILKIERTAVQTRNWDYQRAISIPIGEQSITISGKKYKPKRRCILSTVVAETGVTLENLKYVIDSGWNRETEFNPNYNLRGLLTKPAPRSRVTQRIGRVGRKFPGIFYPLYTRAVYDKLPAQQYPQILVEDLSAAVLDIIREQLRAKALMRTGGASEPTFSVADIDMLDQPTADALLQCLEKLYTLGIVKYVDAPSAQNNETTNSGAANAGTGLQFTQLGELCARLSLPIEHTRMILAAYSWRASVMDVITIAAYLSIDRKSFAAAADPPSRPPADKKIGAGTPADMLNYAHTGADDAYTPVHDELVEAGGTNDRAHCADMLNYAHTGAYDSLAAADDEFAKGSGTNAAASDITNDFADVRGRMPANAQASADEPDTPARAEFDGGGQPKQIAWYTIYDRGMPFKESPYKVQLLICDEFIEGLVLYNALVASMGEDTLRGAADNMRKFCAKVNLAFETVVEFLARRDEICDEMITAGFDILANDACSLARAESKTLMNIVTRLKYCIYDGWRNNLILRIGAHYTTLQGLTVSTPALFKEDATLRLRDSNYAFMLQTEPMFFIYRGLDLKMESTSGPKVRPERVSVLDGFVSLDLDFAN